MGIGEQSDPFRCRYATYFQGGALPRGLKPTAIVPHRYAMNLTNTFREIVLVIGYLLLGKRFEPQMDEGGSGVSLLQKSFYTTSRLTEHSRPILAVIILHKPCPVLFPQLS